METFKYIQKKFGLNIDDSSPIKLPIDRERGLTVLFRELGYKTGAEIGVLRGLYSKWLCHKNKKLKLFLIDSYIAYDGYSKHRKQSDIDSFEKHAHERLAEYNVEFVKKTSMDAVNDFLDNSLDFVYIDANHAFEYVIRDIIEWSKKVRPGGIVAGHDYTNYMYQVKAAVDGWVKAKKIKPLFLTGNKTWFYVKDK